jgi:hypothetical protein
MSYHQGMQKGNLDSVKVDEHGKIKKETVDLEGVSFVITDTTARPIVMRDSLKVSQAGLAES